MKFSRGRFTVELSSDVWSRKIWESRFEAECDEKRSSFDRAVERCVVRKHQRCKILFPVKCIISYQISEIFGDGFIGDLGLAVARGVPGGGVEMCEL